MSVYVTALEEELNFELKVSQSEANPTLKQELKHLETKLNALRIRKQE